MFIKLILATLLISSFSILAEDSEMPTSAKLSAPIEKCKKVKNGKCITKQNKKAKKKTQPK